jgi:HEAT repeat protein
MVSSSEPLPPLAMQSLLRLPEAVRSDLVRILAADSRVRADVIRQFHDRGDDSFVEVLIELEADELLRIRVIAALERSLDAGR